MPRYRRRHHRRAGFISRLGRKVPSIAGTAVQVAGGLIAIGAVAAPASAFNMNDPVGSLGNVGSSLQSNVPQIVTAGVVGTALVVLGSIMKRAARGGLV